MERGVRNVCIHDDFTIKTLVRCMRKNSIESVSYVEAFLIICNILFTD